MPLAPVHTPCAEQQGKHRQQQRDGQARVGAAQGRARGVAGNDQPGLGQRAKLQGDVRQHRRARDAGHQYGQTLPFAETRPEIVGDGGDLTAAAHIHQPLEHRPAEKHNQDRPQIDRRVAPGGSRRAAHRPVESPRATVDSQRQRVDGAAPARVGRRASIATPVSKPRHREQGAHVEQGQAQQIGRRIHAPRCGLGVASAPAATGPASACGCPLPARPRPQPRGDACARRWPGPATPAACCPNSGRDR